LLAPRPRLHDRHVSDPPRCFELVEALLQVTLGGARREPFRNFPLVLR
jgi:hypothetical protein